MELFEDIVKLKLNIYILAIRYLEEGAVCFNKVNGNNEDMIEDCGEVEMVSDLKEEIKKKALYKKKKNVRALLFAAVCPFTSKSTMSIAVLWSVPPLAFASAISVLMSGLFTLLLSAFL